MQLALPLCIVLLSQSCLQASASPVPRSFHPLKDSSSGCLTAIFFLVLSLTILFVFKKIYLARRRKIDLVSIFSDEFSPPTSDPKARRSMTKAKSGFYVGLLGSPGWETKHSLFVGGSPGCISFPPKSHTLSCPRVPTTILHRMPARCDITSARPAPNNAFGDKLPLLRTSVLSPEISRPPLAMVSPEHPYADAKSSLSTKRLSSPGITQDDQCGDFQSSENIILSARPSNSVLLSGLNLDHERRTCDPSVADIASPTQTFRTSTKHAQLRADLFENSIQQSITKPSHFDPIPKGCACAISERSQLYSHDVNYSFLETATLDFVTLSPPMDSHKIPDSPKFCRQSVDLPSHSVHLKPRCSNPTKRTTIGPSPLRAMSLPSDYSLEYYEKLNVNDCSTLSKIWLEDQFESSQDSPASSSHPPPIPKRSKTVLQAEDPDIILELIRELAQETSAWDASLFVNENFKAMIDQYPSCKPRPQVAQETGIRSKHGRKQRRKTPFIPLQDIPEFDVLIVFSEENINPYEVQSFWDDEIDSAYQHDAQPQSSSPGVAH